MEALPGQEDQRKHGPGMSGCGARSSWPVDGGEIGELIRSKDWSETSLGPVIEWPERLKASIDICLGSNAPIGVYWGADLLLFYNDAWRSLVDDRHPSALGRPAREVFPDIWDTIEPVFVHVLLTGEPAGTREDNPSFLESGSLLDGALNYTLSPIRGKDGNVEGIFNIAGDLVERKKQEKLLGVQKNLLERIASGSPLEECCRALCDSVPRLSSGVSASVLFADDEVKRVRQVISPNLSPAFKEAVENTPLDHPTLGTCGEAITHGSIRSCPDVSKDGVYEPAWREACLANGVKATYSVPIFNEEGSAAGAFVLFFDAARDPTEWEERLATFGTRIVSIALERDQSRQALRESEERLRLALDAADMGVWEVEAQPNAPAVRSLKHDRIFGYDEPPDEWDFETFLNHVHPEDRERVEQRFMEAAETGRGQLECRIIRADGEIRWISGRARFYKDSSGTPFRAIGIIQDITQRKTRQDERDDLLKRVETERRRLENIFRQAPSAMCILREPDHVFERANDLYLELIGHRDILGKPVREALPELEGQGFFELLDKVYESGEEYVGSDERVLLQREPGGPPEERFLNFAYQPIRDAHDRINGIFVQGVDLTERKKAEIELARITAESEQQKRLYEAILSSTPDLVYVFDLDYKFTYVNDALLDTWGRTLEDSVGKTLREVGYEPWHAEMHEREIDRVVETRQPVRGEVPFEHATLGERLYDYIFVPVFNARGEVEAVAGTTRDVTEHREVERALQELNETLEARVEKRTKTVRELASKLTMAEQEERRRLSQMLHDNVQQLLYGIQLKMSFVRQSAEKREHLQILAHVDDALYYLEDAINQTRQLTVDLSPPVLKGEGLTDTLYWLQSQMNEVYDLEVEIEAEQAFHIADEDMRVLLFQIVRELLLNVVDHAETDHAKVELYEEEAQLTIQVTDWGRGFDIEEAEDRLANREEFGLFGVRERLGLFGGHIDIESDPDDKTRITVFTNVTPKKLEGATGTL